MTRKINPREANAFLNRITGEKGAVVCFQVFKDRKSGDGFPWHYHDTLKAMLPNLTKAQAKGCGVYGVINRTNGKGREAEDVEEARAVFVDLDGAPLPEEWPLEPHIIVESSEGRYHAYWLVEPTDDLAKFTEIQARLAAYYNGDSSVHDPSRVMRLPGFWHLKGKPFLSRLLKICPPDPERYTFDQIEEAHPCEFTIPKRQDKGRRVVEPPNGFDNEADVQRAIDFLAKDAPPAIEGQFGDKTTFGVACRCRDLGLSEDKTLNLMEEHYNDRCEPPWDTSADADARDSLAVKVRNAYRSASGDAGAESITTLTTEPIDTNAGDEDEDDGDEKQGGDAAEKKTIAGRLMRIGREAHYFQESDGTGYAAVLGQFVPVQSKRFRNWLVMRYLEEHRKPVKISILNDVVKNIESVAAFAPKRRIYTRVAATNDATFVDLCNDAGQFVHITADGWKLITADDLPEHVGFKRGASMRELPAPVKGGTLEELRAFLNVEADRKEPTINDSNFVLFVMWLVACFRSGPYPIAVPIGEAGSAKTTVVEMARSLTDPSVPLSQSLPKKEQDVIITAKWSHVLSYDNVSFIGEEMSDTLCRIATGSGYRTRQLYTNDEEAVFSAKRPMILNGINNAITRADLLDRALVLPLARITQRRVEADLWSAFNEARPRILGVLFDMVAAGIRNLPHTPIDPDAPRMASFDLFARACETAAFKAGTFRAAYTANRLEAKGKLLGGDAVAITLRRFMDSDAMMFEPAWKGTAGELYDMLTPIFEADVPAKGWPVDGQRLANALRRLAPDLRLAWGINVDFVRSADRSRERLVKITT